MRTPDGPVTIHLERQADEVVGEAWGPGAEWSLEHLPGLFGEQDDATGLVPVHDVVRDAHRRHPGFRIARTGLVVEALVPAVIEQKVTGQEAFGGQRRLVRRYGTPAPGPGAELGLVVRPVVPIG